MWSACVPRFFPTHLIRCVGGGALIALEVAITLDQLSDYHWRETHAGAALAALRKYAVFCYENGVRQPVCVMINTVYGGSGSDVTGPEALRYFHNQPHLPKLTKLDTGTPQHVCPSPASFVSLIA